jgi:hypothetical protein
MYNGALFSGIGELNMAFLKNNNHDYQLFLIIINNTLYQFLLHQTQHKEIIKM